MLLKILNNLKQNGLVSLRGEFEAEGMDEFDIFIMNRLSRETALDITIKIGGVEAFSDFRFANLNGASLIIAPMVESEFAVQKFIYQIEKYKKFLSVCETNFFKINKKQKFSINIETITALNNLNNILNYANKNIQYVTVGRVDLANSMNISRKDIETNNKTVEQIIKLAKTKGFKTSFGGGISLKSEMFIDKLHKDKLLDNFETRKLVFDTSKIVNLKQAIKLSIEFEKKYFEFKKIYQDTVYNDINIRQSTLKNKA